MSHIEIIDAEHTRKSKYGERHLAKGVAMSMRMWDCEPAGIEKKARRCDYETIGYVIAGRAEVVIGGEAAMLTPGTSWVVPRGAEHTYEILETFTAIECNSPITKR
jgi:uncharacterized cupin superfamily protein